MLARNKRRDAMGILCATEKEGSGLPWRGATVIDFSFGRTTAREGAIVPPARTGGAVGGGKLLRNKVVAAGCRSRS